MRIDMPGTISSESSFPSADCFIVCQYIGAELPRFLALGFSLVWISPSCGDPEGVSDNRAPLPTAGSGKLASGDPSKL